ncbi:MAG: hypothetical protein JWQ88_745 [Rhodoferax sp.]|nr:hypothetical protein [Rhodoferax sp.]
MKNTFGALTLAVAGCITVVPGFAQTVPVTGIVELSGPGATAGTNFDNGVKLAVKAINAAGGMAGRKIEYTSLDTQTQPGVAKALAKRAIDQGAEVVLGPVFSGSILVSMNETKQAEVLNIVGGEAASITQQGHPYVFRASFTQAAAMPKVATYLKNSLKATSVSVIYVNNDFGKGGRDAIVKALEANGVKLGADISTDSGQVDFSAAVLKAKQADADALFVYTNEEESARLLRELRKQGFAKPIVGESTLTNEKVIELAGDAANGIVGHVGLTADAPNATVQAFTRAYVAEYKSRPDHNAMKGYIGMWSAKAAADKAGKIDSKAMAAALHDHSFSATEFPGLLFDVRFDAKGDLDRESFFVKVVNGRTVVTETLKPAHQ